MRIEAHVDYLRFTVKADAPTDVRWAVWRAFNEVCEIYADKSERKEWGSHGYAGVRYGPCSWGDRAEDTLVQFSALSAAAAASRLPAGGVGLSRLDLAVTAWGEEDTRAALGAALSAARLAHSDADLGRRRTTTLVDGFEEGATVYVGSRRSDQFGRIYEKGKQDAGGQFAGALRWEVQFVNDYAKRWWPSFAGDPDPAPDVGKTVQDWFKKRGVFVPGSFRSDAHIAPGTHRERADDARLLAWLARTVAPVVARLACRYDKSVIQSALNLGPE